jgi:hypothetical protein
MTRPLGDAKFIAILSDGFRFICGCVIIEGSMATSEQSSFDAALLGARRGIGVVTRVAVASVVVVSVTTRGP